jgi:phosphatidylglycerol:prolipoprotein diacylglycerol transferase
MRRVLLQWRGVKIYAYPAMLYLGLVAGVLGGTHAADLHGLDAGRVYAAMLLLILPALVWARLLFVASNWSFYRADPARIWRRSEGGAALYGGLIVSFLLSLPLLRALDLPLAAFWDATAVTMLIGMVITKVGCLLNGCCGGRPTEGRLGLRLPNEHGVWRRRVPTQLLEAGLAVCLLVVSLRVWDHASFSGACILTAVAGYGAGRWWLEAERETIDGFGSLSLHRLISAALVVVCTATFALVWFSHS